MFSSSVKILVLFVFAAAHSASVNFDETVKEADEVKDNSVFDKILTLNQKASKLSSGGRNVYEGDIVITDTVREMMDARKRGAQNNPAKLWPLVKGVREIPYTIHSSVGRYTSLIRTAMNEWEQKVPCFKFVQRNWQRDYINFHKGSGCSSVVGRQGRGMQYISIGQYCENHGIVLHEIGHALGFWHEQSRPDRDNYITIKWNNITPENKFNFDKNSGVDSRGVLYDYDSIMHYGPKAFAINRFKNTIIPKQTGAKIGQRQYLSDSDAKQAKLMYNCGSTTGPICKDGKKDCNYWANVKRYCNDRRFKPYMAQNCRKSCLYCR